MLRHQMIMAITDYASRDDVMLYRHEWGHARRKDSYLEAAHELWDLDQEGTRLITKRGYGGPRPFD